MRIFYNDFVSPTSVTGNAPARSEQVEEAICTHVHALNEELQQQECFWVNEAKLKKRLKTVEKKVGKKTERQIMRQMQKYFQDLRASSLSLPPPEWPTIPNQESSSSSSSSTTDDEDDTPDINE